VQARRDESRRRCTLDSTDEANHAEEDRSNVPRDDVRRTVDWYKGIGFEVKETYGDSGDDLSFAIVAFGAGK